MKRYKTPEQYKAPLATRAEITAFLCQCEGRHWHYGREGSRFVWNVKIGGTDLSPAVLVPVLENSHLCRPLSDTEKAAFVAACEENEATLWQWAIEAARDTVQDSDGYKDLWNGEHIGAVWEFSGRSGGWLCLRGACGLDLRGFSDSDIAELDFPTLRRLYRFIVQCNHDFRRQSVYSEVQHHAAYMAWANFAEPELDALDREAAQEAACLAICAL